MIAIFIFYDKSTGWQRHLGFSKEFQHVDVMCYDESKWILFQANRNGVQHRVFKTQNSERLITKLRIIPEISAIIAVDIINPVVFKWRPFMIYSCNEVCRFLTGIGTGFTFNPIHLYNKLLRYHNIRNYEVIHAWRRKSWDYSIAGIHPHRKITPVNY